MTFFFLDPLTQLYHSLFLTKRYWANIYSPFFIHITITDHLILIPAPDDHSLGFSSFAKKNCKTPRGDCALSSKISCARLENRNSTVSRLSNRIRTHPNRSTRIGGCDFRALHCILRTASLLIESPYSLFLSLGSRDTHTRHPRTINRKRHPPVVHRLKIISILPLVFPFGNDSSLTSRGRARFTCACVCMEQASPLYLWTHVPLTRL